jgi:Protein of unknown function (DUF1573)
MTLERHLRLNQSQNCGFILAIWAVLASFGVCSRQAFAQQWAREMFELTDHDFGTVPRGAKSEFEFKFKNKYKEPINVAAVRTSCACTLPRIGKGTAKTYEEGSIICEFNTKAFVGARAAVVTVVFDRPFYAEVQLTVKGNIRSDITPTPGEIQFGEVDLGNEKTTKVTIAYSGTTQWQIDDVRSSNKHLSVKLDPLSDGKKIEYVMHVKLKNDAPAGELVDEIVLVTNETQFNQVTLPVRANIIPPLAMPPAIELGTIKSGSKQSNKLVIKAKQPFRIEKVDCNDARFKFTLPKDEKTLHFVPFDFQSDDKIGPFRQTVTVHTTLGGMSTAETSITGNISQ